jgi:hypothetical protein
MADILFLWIGRQLFILIVALLWALAALTMPRSRRPLGVPCSGDHA